MQKYKPDPNCGQDDAQMASQEKEFVSVMPVVHIHSLFIFWGIES